MIKISTLKIYLASLRAQAEKLDQSFCFLLFYGAIWGGVLGYSSSTWQVSVETAQVLFDWVPYEKD